MWKKNNNQTAQIKGADRQKWFQIIKTNNKATNKFSQSLLHHSAEGFLVLSQRCIKHQ